ncbi:hypothetical protein G5S35_24845 [Paraburkholderia tropica]|uniref:hypothetical protein n=1 Tax=Paraburkholderia tropica TaxID=92647 RepID=UPI001601D70A|nr:hypothetical protein [Paraburkholderia tropica]QNB14879.1 hypothetical protein G5S35_24845 [Paraburkholderia tropica]
MQASWCGRIQVGALSAINQRNACGVSRDGRGHFVVIERERKPKALLELICVTVARNVMVGAATCCPHWYWPSRAKSSKRGKRNKACADFETNRAEMEKPKHCLRRKQRRKCWLIEQEVQKTRGSFTFFDH